MNFVFIYGPPASGKLTVANELSKLTGYKVFYNHEVLGVLATLFPYDNEKLSSIRKQLSRKLRLEIFSEAAKANVNFVTTFGMSGPEYFDFFREVKKTIEAEGGRVLFVQLIAAKEELLNRVESRTRKGTKIDSKDYLEKLITHKPELFSKFPDIVHLSIDNTSMSAEEVSRKISLEYNLTH